MNTLQTALVNYKANYCPSSSDIVSPLKEQPTKETTMTKTKAPKLSLKQKEEVLNLFNEKGLNFTEVSQVTGYPYSQVQYYLSKVRKRKGGINREVARLTKAIAKEETPKREGRWSTRATPAETVDKIVAYYKAHPKMSYTQAAKDLGLNYTTVRRTIVKYEAGLGKVPPYANKEVKRAALDAAAENQRAVLTDIDREIMRAELKLEILRELKGLKK